MGWGGGRFSFALAVAGQHAIEGLRTTWAKIQIYIVNLIVRGRFHIVNYLRDLHFVLNRYRSAEQRAAATISPAYLDVQQGCFYIGFGVVKLRGEPFASML